MEAVDLVKAGKAPKVPQDHSKKTYESWFKKDLAEVDWAKPVAEVYNLIRASNPAPGAWGTIKGTKLDIFDSAKLAGGGTPGEIVSIGADGVQVAAKDGRILIKRVRAPGGQKISAQEYAASAGLKAGDHFDPPAPKPAASAKK
jgi:methionyl-tRNA formyltransferase